MQIQVCVDVGGTFTDLVVADIGSGRVFHHKVPSTPAHAHQAIVTGMSEVLTREGLSAGAVVALLHGTTVGTNALIQRRIGPVAVVTTRGFRDLLEIGRQIRPKVYDIHEDFPPPLVPRDFRFEVPERMRADGAVEIPLDENAVRSVGAELARIGVEAVVVCFLHSYAYPDHENRAVEILREALPEGIHVIASTDVYPEFREYERFVTAALNGALLTVMDRYLDALTSETQALGVRPLPQVSQSSGGLMSADMARRMPIRASLSGPAAGVAAVVHAARLLGHRNIITLDVGGTSADVALIRQGQPSEVAVQDIGGFPIRLPAIDVTAVGAGGGTIAWIDTDGLLKVGPQSAGADPGPACYGLGGTAATVTDANVCLGRLNQTALLDGRMPINAELSRRAIGQLAASLQLPLTETALGVLRVASATVVRAIRKVSVERGHDPAEFVLFAYGGAGPLFAIDVAREIGIGTVIIPPRPGLMCAEGLRHVSLMNDFVRTSFAVLDGDAAHVINNCCRSLRDEAEDWFRAEGVGPERRNYAWNLELRYRGQNFELSMPFDGREIDIDGIKPLTSAFHEAHKDAYGFAAPEEPIELVNIRLKVSQRVSDARSLSLTPREPGSPIGMRDIVFDGCTPVKTPVYRRDQLAPGQVLIGPGVLEQQDATGLIYPGDTASTDEWGYLAVRLGSGPLP